tara:strand:+ start:108 stop:764 length:657 start_codon:yes stop_codon:yes gene_type:complete
MHSIVKNFTEIQDIINKQINEINLSKKPKIIAVSKTFKSEKIEPLLEHGHKDFGENKVQEALLKWTDLRVKYKDINLHLIGNLQSNKVKGALKIFNFIHSLDKESVAIKISKVQKELNVRPKIFIQINIGNEEQKSGLPVQNLEKFYKFCKDLDLNIIGFMCIPPFEEDPIRYFMRMNFLQKKFNLSELSMGMSSDFLHAIKYNASYLRIGTRIFGQR